MNERQLLKIQKQRHMSNIFIMLLNNPIFKNLPEKDQRAMARLIYKAEMIEMHARDRNLIRTNESFQSIIDAINGAIGSDFVDDRNEFDDDDEDPRR
jgi:TRAP-type C4-dicarboxylate transport system substrate-binding protein